MALEICDLQRPPDTPEAVVAANVFHRAVAFGSFRSTALPDPTIAQLIVNGQTRAAARLGLDLADRLDAATRILAAVDERLLKGDRLITGLVANAPVNDGDHVVADMGALGRVALSISPAL